MTGETLPWLLLLLGTSSISWANKKALLAVTRGNNAFSSQLYAVLRKDAPANLVVSPLSVATAVAMLQAGARGESATALRSSLHFPAEEQLHPGYQSLLQQLQSNGNITLEMVNRIYPAEEYQLNPQFRATLKNYFGAEPQQLNYANNGKAAEHINSFVSQSTHARIQNLIDPSVLDADTRLVLINAIYFKGSWKQQFPKRHTTKMDFYTGETASVPVDMMRLKTEMLYGEIPELDAQAVSLPYTDNRWSMVVLLPNNRTGLTEMEDKLKSFPLEKILRSMTSQEVELYLPRFKLESTLDLEPPLTKLGAGVIFDAKRADLSGISEKSAEGLVVSHAVQKAFIEVNEEGSEAAAATGIVIAPVRSAILDDPTPVVLVDHPFYSLIVHGDPQMGEMTPVFMQRMVRP